VGAALSAIMSQGIGAKVSAQICTEARPPDDKRKRLLSPGSFDQTARHWI